MGRKAPAGSSVSVGFYNTMFMWPMLVFGYMNFLDLCLEPEFERIMAEFAEINRRVYRAFARLPVNFVISHDDIVLTSGPVCSPAWMRKVIFPRYEEFWGIVRAAGKEVIFMVDGCVDAFADDVMACGARGIISEPYTDYKAIARRHRDCFIAGEGDNRVLMRNHPGEIRAMVESMAETGRLSGGYMMCIGNHIRPTSPGKGSLPEPARTGAPLTRPCLAILVEAGTVGATSPALKASRAPQQTPWSAVCWTASGLTPSGRARRRRSGA